MILTDSDRNTIEELAQKWKVKPDIHPNDFIFEFVLTHPGFPTRDSALKYYFEDGQKSAQLLLNLMVEVCKYDKSKRINLLEFASGYGCVTRHMKNVLPFVDVLSCDIHKEAVDFITLQLNANAIVSNSQPNQLILGEKFDVVFALSFFSHMPKSTFRAWLKTLANFVKPGGHLVFTTHGFESAKMLPKVQFDQEGFWFNPASEQKDLDSAEYGLTCSRSEFVFSQISRVLDLRLIYYQEGFWWQHQDVYVFRYDARPATESNSHYTRQVLSKLRSALRKVRNLSKSDSKFLP